MSCKYFLFLSRSLQKKGNIYFDLRSDNRERGGRVQREILISDVNNKTGNCIFVCTEGRVKGKGD